MAKLYHKEIGSEYVDRIVREPGSLSNLGAPLTAGASTQQ